MIFAPRRHKIPEFETWILCVFSILPPARILDQFSLCINFHMKGVLISLLYNYTNLKHVSKIFYW
jgi:hypothetical protein